MASTVFAESDTVVWASGDSWLVVADDFLDRESADKMLLMTGMLALVERPPITVYGRECRMPRDVGFFSDDAVEYRYSGQSAKAQNLPDWMRRLTYKVRSFASGFLPSPLPGCQDFNAVLVNRYRDGNDSISAHSDDESCLVCESSIAAVSLGASRVMRFEPKPRERNWRKAPGNLTLKHGQLVVMGGGFQRHYLHGISKQQGAGLRVSLTLRNHAIGTSIAKCK